MLRYKNILLLPLILINIFGCKKNKNDSIILFKSKDNLLIKHWKMQSFNITRSSKLYLNDSLIKSGTYFLIIENDSISHNELRYKDLEEYSLELSFLKNDKCIINENYNRDTIQSTNEWFWVDSYEIKSRISFNFNRLKIFEGNRIYNIEKLTKDELNLSAAYQTNEFTDNFWDKELYNYDIKVVFKPSEE